jgi:DNA polymerase-1
VLFNRKGMSDYTLYDPKAVEDRFGLPPSFYVDFAALKGDPSDNLPSVPGVGDKTATTLITEFGSVEGLFDHLDDLPTRLAKLRPVLEKSQEQVLRNKRLARLIDDLELPVGPDDLVMGEWDEVKIRELFNALQFRTLLERIHDVRPSLKPVEASRAVEVRAAAEVAPGARRIAVAFVEGADGIAIATGDEGSSWVADVASAKDVLADPDIEVVAHDAKSLKVWLARRGLEVTGVAFDTQVAAYLLDPAPGSYELADLSVRYLNRELPTAARPQDEQQLALAVDDVEPSHVAGARAAALLALGDKLSEQLDKVGMRELMHTIELPLIDVLVRLELVGVAIDVGLLERQAKELKDRITELETTIYGLGGGPFNLNSTPQLRTILYDKLGLKPTRRTKTGYSTDAATLESLRGQHDIVDALLEYRELTKLLSTYLEPLPRLIDPGDHRVDARSAARSSPASPTTRCWLPITRRSSCACSRTSPATRACATRSSATRTSTPRPPRASGVSTSPRCRGICARAPRRSTSASPTA